MSRCNILLFRQCSLLVATIACAIVPVACVINSGDSDAIYLEWGEGQEGHQAGDGVPDDAVAIAPSTKTMDELLAMPWSEMSAADVDRLNLLSGTMPPEVYAAKYQLESAETMSVIDDITGAIWGTWDMVEIPGAYCGDGSPYKIFVMRSRGFINWLLGNTRRLMVYLEPGGACWDYASCTGQTRRGAANPNGIPNNFMNLGAFLDPNQEGGSPNAAISPLVLRNNPTGDNAPTSQWNKVFLPYCTGDVFSGNRVVVYEDPTGANPPITYHHVGAVNVELAIEYLEREFAEPLDLLVTGCSAGSTGALANYHYIRQALEPDNSVMLSDSGPVFPTDGGRGNHYPLQQHIRDAWNLDYILGKLEVDFPGVPFAEDFSLLSDVMAQTYPGDNFGVTMFKRDSNYSIYSYSEFFDLDENIPEEKEQILTLWAEDIDRLTAQYDRYDNLSYFIPYMRSINESHCTSIVEWTGTEIGNSGIDVGDYINDLLDGGDVASYEEADNPADADVSDFWLELVELLLTFN